MSKSRKKPVIKQKHRNYKRTSVYWRPIRRIINQIVGTYKNKYDDGILDLYYGEDSDDLEIKIVEENSIMLGTDIPSPKNIINDWDYCDYWWGFRNPWHDKKDKIKYSRK